jgi:hypothetical protein
LYSATFIIARFLSCFSLSPRETKTHTAVVVLSVVFRKASSEATMCRLWGYQCVPFIVLRRRDFYTKCFSPRRAFFFLRLAAAKAELTSGNLFCIIAEERTSARGIRHHLAATYSMKHMKYCQYRLFGTCIMFFIIAFGGTDMVEDVLRDSSAVM